MEHNCPAVSVIVPIYNVEDFLRQCLDSAVKQTLKNIEIICVDDGTPDSSGKIADEYAEKYDFVRVIHKENGGLSSARNAGMDAARGEYVYFLDSDDYIESKTLEDLYTKAHEEDLDIVYFNAVPFFESEKVKHNNQNYIDYYDRKGDYSGVRTGQAMFALMRANREFMPSVCLQLFRRSMLTEAGLRFYDGIIHEDNLFSFQCMILARRTDYTNHTYFHRRVRGESTMTANQSMKNVQGYLVAYAEMLAFMRGHEVEEDAFEHVSEYLYTSVFGNARRIFNSLNMPSEQAVLTQGDFCAAHFLDMIKRSGETEFERSYIKAENANLRKQVKTIEEDYRTSMAFRVGSVITYLPRLAVIGLRSIKKHGFSYAFRALGMKLNQKFGGSSPLVSFILPVYNVEEFIEQGLDTLLNQTLKRVEIICVDDGSTDRSLEILNAYAEKDSRVRVFTQQNKYAGVARNLGLANARGEYVCFLDSDDFFARGLAETAYNAGKLSNADIVLFGAKHYNNTTGEYKDAKWLLNEAYAPKKQPFNYKDCPNDIYRITTPCPWTKMFRREFVLETGLQYQAIQNSNDLFFTYSALAMAERIVTVDKPLVYYRVGLANNLQSTKSRHPLCFCEAYGAWHDKLAELGALDALRQSYVNVALAGCLYNLRSQKEPEVKQVVFEKLKNEMLHKLEIPGHPEEYYYISKNYNDMLLVLNGSFEEYMENKAE